MTKAHDKITALILETRLWREFHAAEYRRGVRGAQIEAAACAIREQALKEAQAALTHENHRTEK